MTPETFDRLIAANTGGIVLLLPASGALSAKAREAIMTLESHITSQEIEIPVYFTQESEELLQLERDLNSSEEKGKTKAKSAARSMDGTVDESY